MRDLDQADVESDARDMMQDWMDSFWDMTSGELNHIIYKYAPDARRGDSTCVEVMMRAQDAKDDRYSNLYPQDNFDYTSYDYPEYDPQTDHFERFGRPAFPNEY